MDERRTVKVSKYLSKHLRHQPERIGLALDEAGWIEIDELLAATAAHNFRITREELDHVVAANDKQRFAIEGTRIRASQGHSIEIDLGLAPARNRQDLWIKSVGLVPVSQLTACCVSDAAGSS
ncbi:RNA 2'-phosphotransferase, partial [Streptomyces sp. NPDC001401]|uniref:RNA 2'-phosphotransferase n=1 Tax=Streptomyces sp. NPDC001401 TaxID=3364570 RepID=UPI0036CD6C53